MHNLTPGIDQTLPPPWVNPGYVVPQMHNLTPGIDQTTPPPWADPGYVVPQMHNLTPGIDQTLPPTWADPGYVAPQMHSKRCWISSAVRGRVIKRLKKNKKMIPYGAPVVVPELVFESRDHHVQVPSLHYRLHIRPGTSNTTAFKRGRGHCIQVPVES
jgi:hypothetical protein